MSFHVDRFINDQRVESGALIIGLVTTDRVLGCTVRAGARCESLTPDQWRPIVSVDDAIAWEGAPTTRNDAADRVARDHVRESLARAARELFRRTD